MKNVALLVLGVGFGFVVAHEVNKTAAGQRLLRHGPAEGRDSAPRTLRGYTHREAELRTTARRHRRPQARELRTSDSSAPPSSILVGTYADR